MADVSRVSALWQLWRFCQILAWLEKLRVKNTKIKKGLRSNGFTRSQAGSYFPTKDVGFLGNDETTRVYESACECCYGTLTYLLCCIKLNSTFHYFQTICSYVELLLWKMCVHTFKKPSSTKCLRSQRKRPSLYLNYYLRIILTNQWMGAMGESLPFSFSYNLDASSVKESLVSFFPFCLEFHPESWF